MMHIVRITYSEYGDASRSVPTAPDTATISALDRMCRRPLWYEYRGRAYVDNTVVVSDGRSLAPWNRFGTADMVIMAAGCVAAITLALLVNIWFISLVILGAGAAYGTYRMCLPARKAKDRAIIDAYLQQPGALDMRTPDPVVKWALMAYTWWSYPACNYHMSREDFRQWRKGKRDMYALDGAIAYVREHGYLDVAMFADDLPELYESISADHERARSWVVGEFCFYNWVVKYTEQASSLVDLILSDTEIRQAYEVQQMVEANSKLPGYQQKDADEAILLDLKQKVGQRVDSYIVGPVDEINREQAELDHEYVSAYANTLFQ